MKKIIFILIFSGLLRLSSYAECAQTTAASLFAQTPASEIARSAVIFTGKVQEISKVYYSPGNTVIEGNGKYVIVTFQIINTWKGALKGDTAQIKTDQINFYEKGIEYLIYTSGMGENKMLNELGCIRITPIEDADKDLSILKKRTGLMQEAPENQ